MFAIRCAFQWPSTYVSIGHKIAASQHRHALAGMMRLLSSWPWCLTNDQALGMCRPQGTRVVLTQRCASKNGTVADRSNGRAPHADRSYPNLMKPSRQRISPSIGNQCTQSLRSARSSIQSGWHWGPALS